MDESMLAAAQTLFELSAEALRYPDKEFALRLASGVWFKELREACGAAGFAVPEELERAAQEAGRSSALVFDNARREATRLFVGAPDPLCSPYEGVWRCEEDGVAHFQFVNKYSMEIEQLCRDCGLVRPKGTNEPLDHIASELELAAYLCWASAAGQAPAANCSGGSPASALADLCDNHLQVWLPPFSVRLAECAQERYLPLATWAAAGAMNCCRGKQPMV